jgi:hypothetical protein
MKILEDLVERFQLYAVCTDCERMERLPVEKLIDRLGSHLTIDQVRRRLRCGGCGQRTGDIRIVYVGESAKVSGFHYGAGRYQAERPTSLPAGAE